MPIFNIIWCFVTWVLCRADATSTPSSPSVSGDSSLGGTALSPGPVAKVSPVSTIGATDASPASRKCSEPMRLPVWDLMSRQKGAA